MRNWRNWLRGKGGLIALALLVCGMVFAALAGPAESLHTRTQAFRQTVAGLATIDRTVQATISYSTISEDITSSTGSANSGIDEVTLGEDRTAIAAGLSAGHVKLGPGAWTAMVTNGQAITSGYGPGVIERRPPLLVLNYRDTLAANSRLVAGSLKPGAGAPEQALPVTTTAATAKRFGLHPGSVLHIGRDLIVITGLITPVRPASAFWQWDVGAIAPTQNDPFKAPQWVGEVFVDAGQLDTMASMFGDVSTLTWVYPVNLNGVNADQVQGVYGSLNHVQSTTAPTSSEDLQYAASDVTFSTGLVAPLLAFLQTQTAVLAVLLLLFVSLGAIGIAVIFLAARMIADQREDELVMLRARGASARQVAVMLARSAALAAVPAAVAGAAAALAVLPTTGQSAKIGWILTALTLAVAIAAPAVVATWRHRRPAPTSNPARILTAETKTSLISPRALRRIIAELTLAGAAIAGLAILRGQGTTGSGTNWFLTLAPVLVAVPVVVITLRLYPLLVRAALRVARRRAGATSYVALAASARTSLATAGPVFALVLALTLTAFAGMITDGISSGQNSQSWQSTGADAVVTTNTVAVVTPALERAAEEVRGVQHAAAVWTTAWTTPAGLQVNVIAVDPAQYAALTAATPFPAVDASDLGGTSTLRVLASPAAAAALGHGSTQLNSAFAMGPIQVRVTGIITSTPALPTGAGAWIMIPMQTLPGAGGGGTPLPNSLLITGTSINRAQLSAVFSEPSFNIVYRADVLASLSKSPLQHGAVNLMVLTALAAAAIALLNLVLGLALGAGERDLTLTRLTVMGVPHSSRLALTETIPAILAAIIASIACALALPALTSNALDLSVFTTSDASPGTVSVYLRPDLVSVGLPAAILLILTAATLVIQTRTTRHRGPASLLRAA